MNNQEQKNHISNKVLDKIKSGEVKMRPKIYFVFRTILLVLGVLVSILSLIYLASFIIFSLRASGILFLPKFGFPGIGIFLNSLPWILILIVVILIIVLEIFTKRFTFVYRRPILYSLLIIVFIVILGSFIIDRTPFHAGLFWRAQEGRLPAIGSVYRDIGVPKADNVHRGIVSETLEDGFAIETPRGELLVIVITSETRFLPEADIEEGDIVVIMGDKDNSTIEAFGIRKIKEGFDIFPQRRFRDLKPTKRWR